MSEKYPIHNNIKIPEQILNMWQETLNLIVKLVDIPSALVMRVHKKNIEVCVCSQNYDNVYDLGEQAPLDTGLYCETVMDTQSELLVPNALNDCKWNHNPDIELGMIAYYGLPLNWPDGKHFGTICILDNKENYFHKKHRDLLGYFQRSMQTSLATIFNHNIELIQSIKFAQQKEQLFQDKIRILSQALEQSPLSVIITDPDGYIEYVNSSFESITGYKSDDVIGIKPSIMKSGKTPILKYQDLWQTLKNGHPWEGEFQNKKKNGEIFWEYAHIAPVLNDSGDIEHLLGVKEDITERKHQEQKIIYQAHFDNLTNLPNRFLSMDRLTQLINDANRKKEVVAVIFIDLDDFKKINDSLGHEIGDKLLIKASKRLISAVRSGDTVGRLGGDEFIVLLGGLSEPSEAISITENLLGKFRNAFKIENRELLLTASIGIAVYPDDSNNASELLRNADSAMYYSKEIGRNTYSFFTDSMNKKVSRRLQLEEQLHGALDRNEFYVLYQPQVNISNGKIIGAEALVRWSNPLLGQVSPVEFIPIAEQTGIINSLGEYVLKEALSKTSVWHNSICPDFRIAVNLSPSQFRVSNLVDNIKKLIRKFNLSGENLELEITEGVLMSGHTFIEESLEKLCAFNIGIAMDDFGTGYSSLSYLRRYPFNVLKIDRSFINDITIDPSDRELVIATITMAHGLNLSVIAEGVETEEQLEYLRELNCDIAQGYLFSKPVSKEKMTEILKNQSKRNLSSLKVI